MKQVFVICLGIAAGIFLIPQTTQANITNDLVEVNASFTYQGKPVHPFLIEKFNNQLSDERPPMVVTVDIAAAFDTNQYAKNEPQRRDGNWWFAERGKYPSDYKSFGYKWLGKMKNGVHVLEVGTGGGGSGLFMDLLFIKVSVGEFRWQDKHTDQLLLSVVGSYRLGDRYEGDIKVYPDYVIIPASKGQLGGGAIKKSVRLEF